MGFMQLYCVLRGSTGFIDFLMGFMEFYWALLGGYRVLLGFNAPVWHRQLAALATLLAVAACAAPILHDLARLYKMNPQPILLAAGKPSLRRAGHELETASYCNLVFCLFVVSLVGAVTGSIAHAFLWVALWLLLTAKSHWHFRLKVRQWFGSNST